MPACSMIEIGKEAAFVRFERWPAGRGAHAPEHKTVRLKPEAERVPHFQRERMPGSVASELEPEGRRPSWA